LVAAAAVLVASVVSVGVAGATPTPSVWPQVGFDAAHTNSNPYETTLSAANVSGLVPKWRVQDNANPNDLLLPTDGTPIVSDGKVFVAGGDQVQAMSEATGAQMWTFTTPEIDEMADPVVANGIVYVTDGGFLYALNEQSGAVKWSRLVQENTGLVYANGVIYTWPMPFGAPAPPMGAYDAATGAQLWTATVGDPLGPPAVADGEVFAVDQENGQVLNVLSASTGKPLWSKIIGEQTNAAPVVSGSTVIITGIYAHQWAFNVTSGSLIWKKTLAGPASRGMTWFAPAVYNGTLFQTIEYACNKADRLGTRVTARRLSTGAQEWTHVYENLHCTKSDLIGGGPRSPAIANGLVYVAAMNAQKISIFTTAGKPVSGLSPSEYVIGGPIVADGHVFINSRDPSHPASTGTEFVQAFGL
jgi:outer membrane protein assembly factor BamB